MIREAELQSESDKAVKAKIDAKNSLEHYVYQMKNTIEDKDKLADKVTDEDKQTIQDALTDAQDWINANNDAEKEDLEDKLSELQKVCDPIISQIYNQQGGQGEEEFEEEEL